MVDKRGVNPLLGARALLEALESADVTRLEEELHRVAGGRCAGTKPPLDGLERLELLEAVAEAMRSALARMRRGLTDRLEGAAVHLRLLRHLAESG